MPLMTRHGDRRVGRICRVKRWRHSGTGRRDRGRWLNCASVRVERPYIEMGLANVHQRDPKTGCRIDCNGSTKRDIT